MRRRNIIGLQKFVKLLDVHELIVYDFATIEFITNRVAYFFHKEIDLATTKR